MIDLDATPYVEYDDAGKVPLALIETAIDIGQPYKTATVTRNLAIMAGIPAFCLLYKLDDGVNPADATCKDIKSFRVRRLAPTESFTWTTLTPKEWAECLLKIRRKQCVSLDLERFVST